MAFRGPGNVTAFVNRQYNSPIKLYSPANVAETLSKQSTVLPNGAVGIDFRLLAAPNLAKSEVLKMLEEEERSKVPGEPNEQTVEEAKRLPGNVEWPPKSDIKQSPSFFTRCGSQGLKRVAWPPPAPEDQIIGLNVQSPSPGFQKQEPIYLNSAGPQPAGQVAPPWEREPATQIFQQHHLQQPPAQILQTPPPATITLRQKAPVSQAPPEVYASQPVVKRQAPIRMRGDQKWPPATVKAQKDAEVQETLNRQTIRPTRVRKDYTGFFAQNALNPTYPSYRAPPGTQHYIEEGTSNL